MLAWLSRFIDYLYGRCSWCKGLLNRKVCSCEHDDLIVWDDSDELE